MLKNNKKLIAKLTYKNFKLKPFSLNDFPVTKSVHTTKMQNVNKREAEYTAKLVADCETFDYIDSFHKDIKNISLISGGSVSYANYYIGKLPVELEKDKEISVKRDNYDDKTSYTHSWFSMEKLIKTHIISKYKLAHVEHEIVSNLSSGQCVKADLVLSFNKGVLIPYDSSAVFCAHILHDNEHIEDKTEDIKDLNIMKLAQTIFRDGLQLDFSNQESYSCVTFESSGYIRHDILSGVNVELSDC